MATRYFKICLSEDTSHFVSNTIPSTLVISWLARHNTNHYIIVEVEAEEPAEIDEYLNFYGARTVEIPNTILTDPLDWTVLIGSPYNGEKHSHTNKIMRRKKYLMDALNALVLLPSELGTPPTPRIRK